ncbi:MAG TPA: GH92 family glycosyl hydrolase [Bacteroidales bacterium]|nr:GH92 family glycosyl hydrolase [Bacteroidales bacterium]HOS72236.1 GH92 family glycosyl hydrolase [Bacteroidales bacterium]HQH25496.1 GH92 family glycosyl hydrolase [Bacteroidales bacterium]HQJ83552.1 GH92 family glycosyl hydrolase [Bacteroidales bacterium]
MKNSLLLKICVLLFPVFTLSSCDQPDKNPSSFVNPFTGTQYFGHTYPGAALPFAMVHVSPDCNNTGWTYAAGYNWQDSSIMGFSHTHFSGVGMTSGGEILIQPAVNRKLHIVPGPAENPDEGYRSRFDHRDETASPGYYSVLLKDYGIKVELTAGKRTAFHRYTFPETENAHIIIDLGHQIGTARAPEMSEISVSGNTRIEGYKSTPAGRVYFCAEFSKPFLYYGTFDADRKTPESDSGIFPYKSGEKGERIGAFVNYKTSEKEQILVKVALSYTGPEGARKNLEAELADRDFDRVKKDAGDIWNRELSRIEIDGATDEQKEIFYTSLYHSLLAQYTGEDADGKYYGMDGRVHTAEGYDFYPSFSCWDTYRSQHPLLTIIAPEHVNSFLKSIEAKIRDFGWLPAQHFSNVYRESMVGDHLIPIVTDAYVKGYRDFDAEFVYEAMKKKALEKPEPPVPENAGRSGLGYYISLGYTPIDKVTEAVPNTMELAYDDWCTGVMAEALGRQKDMELFMKRALNYRNVWDSTSGFMRPRKADGSFLEELNGREQTIVTKNGHSYYKYFDPLLVGVRPNRHYTESNAWQYIWSVQHDIKGLIDLFGSKEKFNDKLDTFFDMDPSVTGPKYIGVVGTIGQYVHGNQPSHHVAYLYDYSGEPWKTQQRTRQICDQLYRPGPGGLCGNEDMGSLSSWYVFSSLGFYPVTPGSTSYAIGSPVFGKAVIHHPDGKKFTVRAINNSDKNIYIQSATLNGIPLEKPFIEHRDIMNGGELLFIMGPEPSRNWGISAPPPSLSD